MEKPNHTPEEIEEATELSDIELDFIDTNAKRLWDEANEYEVRPYVLLALLGGIAANIVLNSDGETDAETVLEFIKLSLVSQLKAYEGKAQVVVKVQLSLASSDDTQSVLIYDESRTHRLEMAATPEIVDAMDGQPKKYFNAIVNTKEPDYIELLDEVSEQEW